MTRIAVLPHRRSLAVALSLLGVFFVLVPLRIALPGDVGLDASWILGLNQAMAQNLVFGRDVVFTFGPYAAIYTGQFNPATDHLALMGGACVGLCFCLALLSLAREGSSRWVVAFALTAVLLRQLPDAIFLSYLPLSSLAILKLLGSGSRSTQSWGARAVLLVVLLVGLGLLTLIKGSFLFPVPLIAILIGALAISRRMPLAAIAAVVVPAVSCVAFWAIAGQPASGIWDYFASEREIISGYMDGMGTVGPTWEVAWFLLVTGCTIALVVREVRGPMPERLFLVLTLALFYFVTFKSGFARHDAHATIVGVGALYGALLIAMLLPQRAARLVVALALFTAIGINLHYFHGSSLRVWERFNNTIVATFEGVLGRLHGDAFLAARLQTREQELARWCAFPRLQGSVDVYSYQQACLILSGNQWAPRPVFQSYSAYTPALAARNHEHLLGAAAPDHIFLRVEPIDGRLPASEDGSSWPAIFSRYRLQGFTNDALQLDRDERGVPEPVPSAIVDRDARLGEFVDLPPGASDIMAAIDIQPTLLGRVASLLFRSPPLKISLDLRNGGRRAYRLVAGMAREPILVSPHIDSTRDFLALMSGTHSFLQDHQVRRLSIDSVGDKPSWFWRDRYSIRFLKVALRHLDSAEPLVFDQRAGTYSQFDAATMAGACDGSMERINGASGAAQTFESGTILSIEGWTAASAKDGVLADEVLLALTPVSGGAARLFHTRQVPRTDVGDRFKQPGLRGAGYSAYVDASQLRGRFSIAIVQMRHGNMMMCQSGSLVEFPAPGG
jgi:hypothetical protein